jgi:putative tryptophan/tyrosine transport system substrate-binding protein
MRRRDFITFLVSAVAWPLVARAQQGALPVIGFLRSTSLADATDLVTAFRRGLKEAGFVEGQNVAIEYRYADNQIDRLPALVAELIRWPVAVIVGNNNSAIAAKAATTTIPIVFATGTDPVQEGLVTSLNRPGGNVTGVSFLAGVLGAKRLELLHKLVPKATTIGVLVNPNKPDTEPERRDVQAAALALGLQLIILDVSNDRDIETAFATFVQRGAGALFAGTGAFLFSNRERIVALATRHALPAGYSDRESVVAGGLMSYSTNIPDAYHQAGIYTGRILKGEKPADLPVMQGTKFEFVINLKTAKALGLTVSDQMQLLADEVIEYRCRLLRCMSLLLARCGCSRQCGVMPAIEVEADGRRMRRAQPCLTLWPCFKTRTAMPRCGMSGPHGVVLSLGGRLHETTAVHHACGQRGGLAARAARAAARACAAHWRPDEPRRG